MAGAIILCGGQSRRMGRDKAELAFGKHSLLEHQAQKLQALGIFEYIFVATKHPRAKIGGTEQILDTTPLFSPLAGLQSALAHSPCALNLVLAVDCPFVQDLTIQKLLDCATNAAIDAVICADESYLHPLIGAYHKSALTGIVTMLAQNILRVQAIAKFCTIQTLQCAPHETTNCNTPLDYANAQKILGEMYG